MILQSIVAMYLGHKGLPTRKFLIGYLFVSLLIMMIVPFVLEDMTKIYSALYLPGMLSAVLHDVYIDVVYSSYDFMSRYTFIEYYIDFLEEGFFILCLTEMPIIMIPLRIGQALAKKNNIQLL